MPFFRRRISLTNHSQCIVWLWLLHLPVQDSFIWPQPFMEQLHMTSAIYGAASYDLSHLWSSFIWPQPFMEQLHMTSVIYGAASYDLSHLWSRFIWPQPFMEQLHMTSAIYGRINAHKYIISTYLRSIKFQLSIPKLCDGASMSSMLPPS
jgi:hypothetical protein